MTDLFDKPEPEEEEDFAPEKPLPKPSKAMWIITCAMAVLLLINFGIYIVMNSEEQPKIVSKISEEISDCDFNFTVQAPVTTNMDYDCYREMSFFNRMQDLGKPGRYCFFNFMNQFLKSCEYRGNENKIIDNENKIIYTGIPQGNRFLYIKYSNGTEVIVSENDTVTLNNIFKQQNDYADSWYNDTTYIDQDPFNREE